jgi:hypothetical protein
MGTDYERCKYTKNSLDEGSCNRILIYEQEGIKSETRIIGTLQWYRHMLHMARRISESIKMNMLNKVPSKTPRKMIET